MSAKLETSQDRFDVLKWVTALLLLASVIGAFYYYSDQSLLLRVIALLVVGGSSAAILLQTVKGRASWEFMLEARTEVRKVVWPTRKETVQTTSIVIAMVALMAIILWLLDMLLAWGIRLFIGGG
ncbi:MAG: preprotein translocase subunit SecE [Gammaproteobacteria bacterium]|nr:preprotein translocase subunit SecE [Gammaproteobacteria bacterium]